jgi:protein involved in polysaccharide export with SLBB domain
MYRKIKYSLSGLALLLSFAAIAQEGSDPKLGVDANAAAGALSAPRQAVKITNSRNDQANSIGGDTTYSQSKPLESTKLERSEFQNFIYYSTGKNLAVFGSEFFLNSPSTFAPVQSTPVPSEYVLGTGDEILIRAWGSMDMDFHATLDRNGSISIPTLGGVSLAGVKAGDAEGVIKAAVARQYRDVTVAVSFGRLRAITVYVVGQARKPGSYTVSGFSTLVTALLVSGGPNANGSLRNVQVKRAGKLVGSLDLYAFIAKGDKSNDVKLLDGDTIFIPPAVAYVALVGKVNTPGIYELRSTTESVASVLELAGGLPVVADPRRAFLERIEPGKQQPRSVEEFALDQAGLKKSLKNGDLLTMSSVTPDFANAVTLRGNVDQAVRVPLKPGMRIRDLIPNREMLITRASVQRQNDVLIQKDKDHDSPKEVRENSNSIAARIGNLIDDINWDYAVIERVDRGTLSVTLIPFHLGKVLDEAASADNLLLQAGDAVTVFSQNDVQVPMSKRKVFARIEGEVNAPGVYQMLPGDTLTSLIAKAGGTTNNAYLFGTEFYREKVRQEQQVNLEKVLRRLESQMRSERAKSAANLSGGAGEAQLAEARLKAEADAANEAIKRLKELKATGRIAFGLNASETSFDKLPVLRLENGDQLVIPSRPDFVHIFGAVNQESSLIWRSGMTVEKYLAESGPTSEADLESIFILRANGSVLSSTGRGWFSSVASTEIMPGDSIVVPERLNKETAYKQFTNGLKDWAQILSGFGLGMAALRSL